MAEHQSAFGASDGPFLSLDAPFISLDGRRLGWMGGLKSDKSD
jgi:hypothetical protein